MGVGWGVGEFGGAGKGEGESLGGGWMCGGLGWWRCDGVEMGV